ncbi:hypothetical protein [Mucilaginibacter jinjuensis]|uniref:Uncharacterized protein n=1 Tax=Mucilaginibacter jinjuensis TaxID=1176721 RepID=A0ABY7TF86_9SPHI|nr:hypothetical protein [Mucilaginibacter jinjuensis]WCT14393.1 hypothetical protein PQO05_10655 [Mucilaginibacter jinjuensis]
MEKILKGNFLAERHTDDYYINLYDVDGYYVEVFFHHSTHLITHFRASIQTSMALPYLENIDVLV